MSKVKVDKDKCIGCGACEALCGKIFIMKNGKAEVKMAVVEGENEECSKEARDSCPVGAIEVN